MSKKSETKSQHATATATATCAERAKLRGLVTAIWKNNEKGCAACTKAYPSMSRLS